MRNPIHVAFCETLGLDPDTTDTLIIHSEATAEPRIVATFRFKDAGAAGRLVSRFEEYRLEERGERVNVS